MNFRYSKKIWHFSNQLCKDYWEKKIKTGPKFKNRIIVKLFFYFFIFFLVNFFLFQNISKFIADSETVLDIPFTSQYQQIQAISDQMAGRGGA